jgi:hypothetical protein
MPQSLTAARAPAKTPAEARERFLALNATSAHRFQRICYSCTLRNPSQCCPATVSQAKPYFRLDNGQGSLGSNVRSQGYPSMARFKNRVIPRMISDSNLNRQKLRKPYVGGPRDAHSGVLAPGIESAFGR